MQPDSLGILGGFRKNIMVEFRISGRDAQAVVAVSVRDERFRHEAESNLASFDAIAFLQQAGVLVAVAGREAVGEEGDVATGEGKAGIESASDGGGEIPSPEEERDGDKAGDDEPGLGFERHF